MAEGALRHAAAKAGLDIRVDSAGTAGYHIGENPDSRAIAVARSQGVDISALIGRQLSASDFHDFTHVFALDAANMAGINARAPRHGTAHVAMLLDAIEGQEGKAVPDPYYGDESDFETCWATVSEAADALVARFLDQGVDARF